MVWRLTVAVWFPALLIGQIIEKTGSPEGYVGAARCAECHPAQFASQSQSEHAHALAPSSAHRLRSEFPTGRRYLRAGRYQFEFNREGEAFELRAWDADQEARMGLDWAFGAGTQAVTFVTRANAGAYLEMALSYYPASRTFGTTPGQEPMGLGSLATALGRLYASNSAEFGIRNCFGCHSTGPVALRSEGELVPLTPGIQCESCHGPGAEHVTAASQGNRAKLIQPIRDLRQMSASGLNQFCGSCHRLPAPSGIEIDWNVSWNVRHQPVYLSQSLCFRQSRGTLSCLTCHGPHDSLVQNDGYYDAKCRDCHTTTLRKPASACGSVAAANCIDCHMPRVSPQSNLRFTNHWIGVYGEGAKLKPITRTLNPVLGR
jgi:hypothetical protein